MGLLLHGLTRLQVDRSGTGELVVQVGQGRGNCSARGIISARNGYVERAVAQRRVHLNRTELCRMQRNGELIAAVRVCT
jgi:hypothetical protein